MGLLEVSQRRRVRWGLWFPIVIGVVACFSLIGLSVLTTVLSGEETDEEAGLVYGLTLLPTTFDPHFGNSSELGIPLYSVYDTLIYRHPQTLEFVPGLAERWEISPDGLTYTFYLRRDVVFHDGTPFNADAVGVTFDRILNSENIGKARALLGPYFVSYVIPKEVDSYTFQLIFSSSYAPLLDALSQPYFGIASPTALANHSRETYQYHQVGTGPYKMVRADTSQITLERNEDYRWGPVFYAPAGETSVKRITFRFFIAPETRRLALESGDVSIVGEILPEDAQILLANRDYQVYTQPLAGQPLQFYFNTTRFPTDDIRFRQALLYATSREAIVDTVFFRNFSPVAYGPLTANSLYYDEGIADFYTSNIQQARALFNNAGIRDSDNDGFLDQEGIPLKLKIVIAGWGSLPEVAALLQSQWREIGLQVEIQQVPNFTELLNAANSGDYNLIALNDFGTDPSILNRYFLSTGDRNLSRFSDPDLDTWLLQAAQSNDAAVRRQLYSLVQRKIMEQALVLPIRDYVNLVGWSTDLEGLIFAAPGWWPLLANLQNK